MKRSEALAPLSRDHHHALVLATRLSRAREADATKAAAAFVEFLSRHELTHFALEESVVLPAARSTTVGRRLASQVLAEHAQLREDLRHLRGSTDPPPTEYLHAVGGRLRAHVMLEERELFPHLEQTLDARALAELAERLSTPPGRSSQS